MKCRGQTTAFRIRRGSVDEEILRGAREDSAFWVSVCSGHTEGVGSCLVDRLVDQQSSRTTGRVMWSSRAGLTGKTRSRGSSSGQDNTSLEKAKMGRMISTPRRPQRWPISRRLSQRLSCLKLADTEFLRIACRTRAIFLAAREPRRPTDSSTSQQSREPKSTSLRGARARATMSVPTCQFVQQQLPRGAALTLSIAQRSAGERLSSARSLALNAPWRTLRTVSLCSSSH